MALHTNKKQVGMCSLCEGTGFSTTYSECVIFHLLTFLSLHWYTVLTNGQMRVHHCSIELGDLKLHYDWHNYVGDKGSPRPALVVGFVYLSVDLLVGNKLNIWS